MFFLKDCKRILNTFKRMYKLAKREIGHAIVKIKFATIDPMAESIYPMHVKNI